MRHRAIAALLLAACSGCIGSRPATTPIGTRSISPDPAPSGSCLVVFLPGRRDGPGAYGRHRFPRIAAEAGVTADYLEADAHLGYYVAETISTRLYEDVLAPARARGREKIWIVGISMGGLGGLLSARDHPDATRGVVALAPFLGDTEPGLVAAAGGLSAWRSGYPRPVADYERELWGWLQRYTAAGATKPPVWLGWGLSDDLAGADKLLGDALPPARTLTVPGAHDWRTWTELWRAFLATGALQNDCRAGAAPSP
ncbi:MAG: alpha/beta hydrolase-fold protein [Acidobacteriota bacterium]